jgi:hypothetical protein
MVMRMRVDLLVEGSLAVLEYVLCVYPPACFETGFGFVSGFEEVKEFFKKNQKLAKL